MKSFTPLVILAICAGAYFLYLSPTYSDIQTLKTKRDQYAQVLQTAKKTAAVRDQALSSYNSISTDGINRLQKIIPDNFQSVVFADHLSSIAGKNGFVINDLSVSNASEEEESQGQQVMIFAKKSYKTTTVSFSTKGSYSSFVSFLKDLESDIYLSDITSLKITSDNSGKKGELFDFSISLDTYSLN
jgi:Tfp pilus assembly protein PilO